MDLPQDLEGRTVICQENESLAGSPCEVNSCVLVLRGGPVAPRRSLLNFSDRCAQLKVFLSACCLVTPVRFSGMGWILGAETRQPRQS